MTEEPRQPILTSTTRPLPIPVHRICVCPVCQHEIDKPEGKPCKSVECPKCGNPMVKSTKGQPT
jgi:hypothetical protein